MDPVKKVLEQFSEFKWTESNKDLVVNRHHKKPYHIYVGRGSEWGNPYSHLPSTKAEFKVVDRKEAIEKYIKWIVTQKELLMKLRYLRGRMLGCYCAPSLCHGHILAVMAHNYEYWEEYAEDI